MLQHIVCRFRVSDKVNLQLSHFPLFYKIRRGVVDVFFLIWRIFPPSSKSNFTPGVYYSCVIHQETASRLLSVNQIRGPSFHILGRALRSDRTSIFLNSAEQVQSVCQFSLPLTKFFFYYSDGLNHMRPPCSKTTNSFELCLGEKGSKSKYFVFLSTIINV